MCGRKPISVLVLPERRGRGGVSSARPLCPPHRCLCFPARPLDFLDPSHPGWFPCPPCPAGLREHLLHGRPPSAGDLRSLAHLRSPPDADPPWPSLVYTFLFLWLLFRGPSAPTITAGLRRPASVPCLPPPPPGPMAPQHCRTSAEGHNILGADNAFVSLKIRRGKK